MKCASLRPMWPEVASDGQLMDNISTGQFQHSFTCLVLIFWNFGTFDAQHSNIPSCIFPLIFWNSGWWFGQPLMDNISTGQFQHSFTYFCLIFGILIGGFWQLLMDNISTGQFQHSFKCLVLIFWNFDWCFFGTCDTQFL